MAASWREPPAAMAARPSPPSSTAASVMAAEPRKARRWRVPGMASRSRDAASRRVDARISSQQLLDAPEIGGAARQAIGVERAEASRRAGDERAEVGCHGGHRLEYAC